MKLIVHPLGLATILVLSGCGQEGRESQSTSSFAMETRQAAELPNGFFLNEVPSNAVPLSQARVNAKTGESIAFTGYIGGRKEPFTVDRAIFLVADAEKSPTCDDGCQTPWDACCTPSEVIAANSAAVQVLDTNGQTMRLSLKGLNGLVPGVQIAVFGKVREANDNVFIVDASGVAIVKKQ